MKMKQLWCVGYYRKEKYKLSFRIYEVIINSENYTIDFDIELDKYDFLVTCHPDIIVINNIKDIKFKMIAKTKGCIIEERLENNTEFINMILPDIKEELFNKPIHINFELNKEARKLLVS